MQKGKRVAKKLNYRQYRALVEPKWLTKARKIGNVVFFLIWAAVIVVSIIAAKRFLAYSLKSFEEYEASQLSYAFEDSIEKLNAASAEELRGLLATEEPEASEFDDVDAIVRGKYEELAASDLSAKEVQSKESGTHRYALYSGESQVGHFEIRSTGKETRLGLLTLEKWAYDGGEVYFSYPSYERSITLPEGFAITVNGIPADESYLTGERKSIPEFHYMEELEKMPQMVGYSFTGLLEEPDIQVTDNLGEPVEIPWDGNKAVLPAKWNASDCPEELREWVIGTYKLWSEYCLLDRTLEEVETILIPDSSLWTQVQMSDSELKWIDKHTILGYEDEQVSDYIAYSDSCFSCRVRMLRHIFVEILYDDAPDYLDEVLFFKKADLTDNGIDDPEWYLVDLFAYEEKP